VINQYVQGTVAARNRRPAGGRHGISKATRTGIGSACRVEGTAAPQQQQQQNGQSGTLAVAQKGAGWLFGLA
jgi:hypothetical protein